MAGSWPCWARNGANTCQSPNSGAGGQRKSSTGAGNSRTGGTGSGPTLDRSDVRACSGCVEAPSRPGELGPHLDQPVGKDSCGLLDVPLEGRALPLGGKLPSGVPVSQQHARAVRLEVDHLHAPGPVVEQIHTPLPARPGFDQCQRSLPRGQQHRVLHPGSVSARRNRARKRGGRMGHSLVRAPHIAVRHIKTVEDHSRASPPRDVSRPPSRAADG